MIRETAFLLKVVDHKIGETDGELWVCGFFYCWLWRQFEWWNFFLLHSVAQEGISFCFASNHIEMIQVKTLSLRSFLCNIKDEGKDLVYYKPPSPYCPLNFSLFNPAQGIFLQPMLQNSKTKWKIRISWRMERNKTRFFIVEAENCQDSFVMKIMISFHTLCVRLVAKV